MTRPRMNEKWWVAPDGTVHDVPHEHSHTALEILRRPLYDETGFVDERGNDMLYNRGWARVGTYGGGGHISFARDLKEPQRAAIARLLRGTSVTWSSDRSDGHGFPWSATATTRTNPWDDTPRGWIDVSGRFIEVGKFEGHELYAREAFLDELAPGEDPIEHALGEGWVKVTGYGPTMSQYGFVGDDISAAQKRTLRRLMADRQIMWFSDSPHALQVTGPSRSGSGFHWSVAGKKKRSNPCGYPLRRRADE